jgi:hypothetical protein
MSVKSEHVKKWREVTKSAIVESMGGKCFVCGYNKCNDALELHHKNPSEKEFSMGKIMANPKAWFKIVEELKKCILLCSNHHREVHKGIISVPCDINYFDESFSDFRKVRMMHENNPCPICGKMKSDGNITCSKECAAKRARTIKWESVNVVGLNASGMTNTDIGDLLGVSGAAVFKRLKKLGVESKYVVREKRFCLKCGVEVCNSSKSGLCFNCFGMKRRKVDHPPKEQLEKEMSDMSMVSIGKKYGVSDNAIRKWAKNYGIIV